MEQASAIRVSTHPGWPSGSPEGVALSGNTQLGSRVDQLGADWAR